MALPDVPSGLKPRLRGVVHQWAFFVSLATGAALVALARGGTARAAVAVYAISLSGLFGTSALYHRVTWTPRARRRMRRLDHSMIFVLIAGTTTPFAILGLEGAASWRLLGLVWGGALAGVILAVAWAQAPKALTATIAVAVGCAGITALGSLHDTLGWLGIAGLAAGGVLYTVGAAVYVIRRPDPVPAVFGYHEVFHVLVVAAAALHLAVVAGTVV